MIKSLIRFAYTEEFNFNIIKWYIKTGFVVFCYLNFLKTNFFKPIWKVPKIRLLLPMEKQHLQSSMSSRGMAHDNLSIMTR